MLEFFAGCGSLSMAMREVGHRVGSLDIKYHVKPKRKLKRLHKPHGSNPMDMNSVSGFAFLN